MTYLSIAFGVLSVTLWGSLIACDALETPRQVKVGVLVMTVSAFLLGHTIGVLQ